jgi:hypothetical protein
LRRTFVSLLLCLAPLAARADALRLVAPASGATLRGGAFATLQWSATSLPAEAEEWEAFLSIDGGRYYAFRITPHLDIARRSFTWSVPNVDARDARILIRTGDEEHESHLALPGSFTIVHDARAPLALPRVATSGHAEGARDGEADVVAWADGEASVQSAVHLPDAALRAVAIDRDDETVAAPKSLRRGVAIELAFVHRVAARTRVVIAPQLPPSDLLLICSRLNV